MKPSQDLKDFAFRAALRNFNNVADSVAAKLQAKQVAEQVSADRKRNEEILKMAIETGQLKLAAVMQTILDES